MRRQQLPNKWELQAAQDWRTGGRLIGILSVMPHFSGLSEESPYFDVHVELVSTNLHRIDVTDVSGRIAVPDASNTYRDLHTPPELTAVERRHGTTSDISGIYGPVQLKRNDPLVLRMRQHVLPAVRDSIRARSGEKLSFDFGHVNVGLSFPTWGQEYPPVSETDIWRNRLPLQRYDFLIPGES